MQNIIKLINDAIVKSTYHKAIKEVREIGTLHVPTGKIVVCDPLVDPEAPSLTTQFPKGDFPVFLYFHKGTEAIALAELRFSDVMPEKWQMALIENQDMSELKEGEIFGYPVDAGLGCFMDVEGQNIMLKHESELMQKLGNKFSSYYDDYVDDLFYGQQAVDENYCIIKPYNDNPNNVIVFQSGFGDGLYASYIAFDKNGLPVRLVTDFGIIG